MTKRLVRETINLALADDYSEDMIERGIRAATLDAHAVAVQLVSGAGSGRAYRRNGVVHRASSPGDSPALDTGTLRASLGFETARTLVGTVGTVYATAEYAAALEFGTERMKPRPYLSRIPGEFGARIMAVFERFAR